EGAWVDATSRRSGARSAVMQRQRPTAVAHNHVRLAIGREQRIQPDTDLVGPALAAPPGDLLLRDADSPYLARVEVQLLLPQGAARRVVDSDRRVAEDGVVVDGDDLNLI